MGSAECRVSIFNAPKTASMAAPPQYQWGVGGSCDRLVICPGDTKPNLDGGSNSKLLVGTDNLRTIAERCATDLHAGLPSIHAGFLSPIALSESRSRVAAAFAKQNCEFFTMIATIDALRVALTAATGRRLSETLELQALHYPQGGSFRRHVDGRPGFKIGPSERTDIRRSLSFVVYLTHDDFNPAADGGALRFHTPDRGLIDVQPRPGQLVLFDSATLPHEVLTTRRDRLCLAGWMHEQVRA